MRYLTRLGAAAVALGALTALMTGTALAGGWAEVVITDGSEGPPIAGEEREIQFTLLQHGVTAVDFGEVQLTAVNSETGESITVPATNHRRRVLVGSRYLPGRGRLADRRQTYRAGDVRADDDCGRPDRWPRLAARRDLGGRLHPRGGCGPWQHGADRAPAAGANDGDHDGARGLTQAFRVRAPAVRSHRRGFSYPWGA